MSQDSGEPGLAFAEKLLALLDSGRYTATYKFAALIALIDVCIEDVDAAGRPPERISAARLGRRVLELLWRHALPYDSQEGEDRYLSHSTQANDLVAKITRFRRDHGLGPGATPGLADRLYPVAFDALQDEVVATVIRMPLPKLQRFGTGSQFAEDRFLYDYRWPDEVSMSRIGSADFDDGLYLQPGVGEWLIRLAGLLRPIIQQRWAAFVADRSDAVVEVAQLDRFLFGASRINLGPFREPLLAAQSHDCFYCLQRLAPKVAEVDHFVPWSRHPDDGLDNLVAAHRRCNNAKRDSLAATAHLGRWMRRFETGTDEAAVVTGLAAELGWPRRPAATLGSARAAYLWLPAGALLWDAPDRYLRADPAVIAPLFAIRAGAPPERSEGGSPLV